MKPCPKALADEISDGLAPGPPGLEWKQWEEEDSLKDGEWGFFLIYDSTTKEYTFTHLVNSPTDDDEVLALGLESWYLGPLPPPLWHYEDGKAEESTS